MTPLTVPDLKLISAGLEEKMIPRERYFSFSPLPQVCRIKKKDSSEVRQTSLQLLRHLRYALESWPPSTAAVEVGGSAYEAGEHFVEGQALALDFRLELLKLLSGDLDLHLRARLQHLPPVLQQLTELIRSPPPRLPRQIGPHVDFYASCSMSSKLAQATSRCYDRCSSEHSRAREENRWLLHDKWHPDWKQSKSVSLMRYLSLSRIPRTGSVGRYYLKLRQ